VAAPHLAAARTTPRRVITDKPATYPACPPLGRARRIASNRAVPNEMGLSVIMGS